MIWKELSGEGRRGDGMEDLGGVKVCMRLETGDGRGIKPFDDRRRLDQSAQLISSEMAPAQMFSSEPRLRNAGLEVSSRRVRGGLRLAKIVHRTVWITAYSYDTSTRTVDNR